MKESKIAKWMKYEFEKKGFKVLINSPFTGSMVPSGLKIDSVMIEINRKLYLDGNYNYIGNKKLEIVLKEIIEKISV